MALAALDRNNPKALLRVAQLYTHIGAVAKANNFARQAHNRARSTELEATVSAEIDELRACGKLPEAD